MSENNVTENPMTASSGNESETESVTIEPVVDPVNDISPNSASIENASVESGNGDKTKKKWPVILAVILLVLAGVYGGGAYYYQTHFPHNISVNGYKLGEMTVEEAEHAFTEDYDAHSIVLEEKERKEIIDASKIGTVIKVGDQVKDLFATMNPWLWFTNLMGEQTYTLKLDVTFDEAALQNAVDSLEAFKEENIVAPVSASIKQGEKEFEIVPEILGNTVLKENLITRIEECLSTCVTSIHLEKENLYLLPEYFAEDQVVKDALAKANTYTKGTIIHDFQYAQETLDYSKSKDWIHISKNFKVKLDESLVGDYVDALGKKYNTMGGTRPFITSYGNQINVPGGDYGWRIDFKKEKKKLIEELKSGEDVNREPIYSYTAEVRSAETDLGNTYVEVSIDAQELWLYVDGECIMNSSVVTGGPKGPTEKGVYGITYKKRGDDLEGFNPDGSSYSSHVEYWMPFNGNQGLHDASWRDDFGGNIYKSNGSHGCVNCPPWAAETLYRYVDENFPVVIY